MDITNVLDELSYILKRIYGLIKGRSICKDRQNEK